MADRVAVTRGLSANSGFARSLEGAIARKVAAQLQAVVDDAAAEAKRVVSTELVNDRPPLRRKKGARHLLGGISAEVEWDGVGFPVTLVGRAIGDQHKIGALEFGSPPHRIRAVNAEFLIFPSTKGVATEVGRGGSIIRLESGKRPTPRARAQAYRSGGRVQTKEVRHPGNRAYRFLERGLERAVRAALGGRR